MGKVKWAKDKSDTQDVCRTFLIVNNGAYIEFVISKGDFGFILKRTDGYTNNYIGTFPLVREAQSVAELIINYHVMQ